MSDATSKYTMICFPCRYTTKATWMSRRCPHCGSSLENAGKHFNVPKKSDDKGWEKSEAFQRERTKPRESFDVALAKTFASLWKHRRHEVH